MATPRTLEEYIAQQGYRQLFGDGRWYTGNGGEEGYAAVNPEDEFYPIQKRAQVESNVLSGLQKTDRGYLDPATGQVYSYFPKGTSPGVNQYAYDPYRGLTGLSTQGDILYGPQATGVYSDAGKDYWLSPGYMNNSDFRVQAPIHDSYGLTDSLIDYGKFALGAYGMYGGVDALANNLGPTLSNLTNTMPAATAPAGAGVGGLGGYSYMADAGGGTSGWEEFVQEFSDSTGNIVDNAWDFPVDTTSNLGTSPINSLPNPAWLNPTGVTAEGLPTLSSGQSLIPGAGTVGQNYLATGTGYPTAATVGGAAGLTAAELASIGSNLVGPTQQGAYQFPYGQAIGAGLGALGNVMAAGELADATKQAASMADPFASERAFYQGKLRELYNNPEALMNNSLFTTARNQAMDSAQRKLVSKGYSGSGNEALEMMKAGTNASLNYALPYLQQTGTFAGAGFGPGQAGSIAMQGATNQAQNQQSMWGNLGYGLGSIFQGNQPDTAEKWRTNSGGNQTLADLIRSF